MAHFYRGEATPDPAHWNGVTPPSMRVDLTNPGTGPYGALGPAH